jgi:GntR family transcriptional regulator
MSDISLGVEPLIHPGRRSDQVQARLTDLLKRGDLTPGQRLPALTQLAADFGVSVPTVREALGKLEAVGLVEVVHGRGVFVAEPRLQWEARFRSFSETVRERGGVPGSQLLAGRTQPADVTVAAQLEIHERDPVHYLQRLRTVDGRPHAVEESYLPVKLLPDLLERYHDPISLYQLLERTYGLRLVAGQHTVEAVLLDDTQASELHASVGSPGLKVSTIAYDADHVPVECGFSVFPADRHRYVARLTR